MIKFAKSLKCVIITVIILVVGIASFDFFRVKFYETLVSDNSCYIILRCAPDRPFHPIDDGTDAVQVKTMYVENHGWSALSFNKKQPVFRETKFYKAWLEYNDKGKPFSNGQRDAILNKLQEFIGEEYQKGKPVYVVVYIHGWHHNADDSVAASKLGVSKYDAVKFDYFVARHADQLRRLYEQREKKRKLGQIPTRIPTVLGIYVGWRGDSLTNSVLKLLTIGNRAAAADNLGSNHKNPDSLYQTLKSITTAVKETNPESRALIAGHSLGGRVLSGLMLSDLTKGIQYPFGSHTLAVALEPAIGADCFDPIFASKHKTNMNTMPSLILLTSKDDWALKNPYSWGSFVHMIEACDRGSKAGSGAIGFAEDYKTHGLHFDFDKKDQIECKNRGINECQKQFKKLKSLEPFIDFPVGKNSYWWQQFGKGKLAYTMRALSCDIDKNSDCFDEADSLIYSMDFERKEAFNPVSPVWNIETDGKTINYQGDRSGGLDATHNGYISTNMTRLIVEFLYKDKN